MIKHVRGNPPARGVLKVMVSTRRLRYGFDAAAPRGLVNGFSLQSSTPNFYSDEIATEVGASDGRVV